VPELALDHPEGMLDLRTHDGLQVLDLVDVSLVETAKLNGIDPQRYRCGRPRRTASAPSIASVGSRWQ